MPPQLAFFPEVPILTRGRGPSAMNILASAIDAPRNTGACTRDPALRPRYARRERPGVGHQPICDANAQSTALVKIGWVR
jgi:hypothetical protein